MQQFYGARLAAQPVISRAQALRQAQLALLRGAESIPPGVTSDHDEHRAALPVGPGESRGLKPPVDPTKPWAHPYYWAPFVLSGNWL